MMRNRRDFLLFLSVFLLLVTGIAWYMLTSYAAQRSDILQRYAEKAAKFEDVFHKNVIVNASGLKMGMELLLNDNLLIRDMALGNRDSLAEKTVPLFDNHLKPSYGIEQFQFHTPPATSFLRVHKPARHSDDLSAFRHTVTRVNQKKESVAGLELGRAGMSLRVVYPVSYDDKHIGSVEFGKSLPAILDFQQDTMPMDYAVAVKKSALAALKKGSLSNNKQAVVLEETWLFNRISTPQVKQLLIKLAQPVQTQAQTVRTLSGLISQLFPDTLLQHNDKVQLFTVNKQQHLLWRFYLSDFHDEEIGQIILFQDISQDLYAAKRDMLITGIIAVVVLLLIGLFGFFQFCNLRKRLDAVLNKGARDLEEKEAQLQAIQQKFLNFEQLKRGFIATLRNKMISPLLTCEGLLYALNQKQSNNTTDENSIAEQQQNIQHVADSLHILRLQLEDYRLLEECRENLLNWQNTLFAVSEVMTHLRTVIEPAMRNMPFVSLQIMPVADNIQLFVDRERLQDTLHSLLRYVIQYSERGNMIKFEVNQTEQHVCFCIQYHSKSAVQLPHCPDTEFLQHLQSAPFPQDEVLPLYLSLAFAVFYGGKFRATHDKDWQHLCLCLPMTTSQPANLTLNQSADDKE